MGNSEDIGKEWAIQESKLMWNKRCCGNCSKQWQSSGKSGGDPDCVMCWNREFWEPCEELESLMDEDIFPLTEKDSFLDMCAEGNIKFYF